MTDEHKGPSIVVLGRPRADEPRAACVTAWLPASAHDRLIQLAKEREVSVSAFVRSVLLARLSR